MWNTIIVVLLLNCVNITWGLLCYNCSSLPNSETRCAGDFVSVPNIFNSTKEYLINCTSATGENGMCFVRSWSARAKHSWVVQRGCYWPGKNDKLMRTVNIPTRSMTCRHIRYPEAEFKVCLCQADWCNVSSKLIQNPYWVHTFMCLVTASYLLKK